MSYATSDQPDLLNDINKRKEFYQYYTPEREIIRKGANMIIDRLKDEGYHLELNSYQAMVAHVMDPNTPYARILLKWDPGMGKTIGGVSTAILYVRLFNKESELDETAQIGTVTIIGFTENNFKKELLSYPQYGYVTREELQQLEQMQADALSGGTVEKERHQEFLTKLRKRLTSKHNGGYFRFFGYKAFVSRIFILSDSKRDINTMSEDEIRQALRDGSLKWDRTLLDSFKNSLLICDEIHDIYNSLEKNNWGIAIQMLLDHVPSLKAIFMSATPLNNSPTEIVDLCNLLNPPTKRVTRADLFTKESELLPHALEKIADLVRGKISFVQDSNPEQFATQTIMGETIPEIPYLKFHRVPMSPFHWQTYQRVYSGTLSQDAQYLVDFALPNPDEPAIGLYKTTEIKQLLSYVDDTWVQKNGFRYKDGILQGPGFDEKRIGTYSAKYAELLRLVKETLKPNAGKVFIFHTIVHMSGVLFAEQLLQQNGFIAVDQSDTINTLCSVCGIRKGEHPEEKTTGGANVLKLSQLNPDQLMRLGRLLGHKPLPMTYVLDHNIGNPTSVGLTAAEYHGNELINIITDTPRQGHGKQLVQATATYGTIARVPIGEESFFLAVGFREQGRDDVDVFLRYEPQIDGGSPIKIKPIKSLSSEQLSKAFEIREQLLDVKDPWAINSWVALDGDDPIGFIEYEDGEGTSTILRIGVREDMQRKRIGTQLVRTTMPPLVDVLVDNLRPMKFWMSLGYKDDKLISGGAKRATAQPITHKFMPARYIMAHSNLDKNVILRNIDRFNSPDNTYGYLYKFIVGSKIIRQSYNFKAIRYQFILSRPDNISILLQVLGRARRRDSHKPLPPDERHIVVRLITSCQPVKEKGRYKLSHEEQKYGEKVHDYITIQKIEKVMHEQAIDAAIVRPIIEPSLSEEDELGALWYKPAAPIPSRGFALKDLNMSTFDVFHSDSEVNSIIYVIKRLFIEQSLAFRYVDLWKAVRDPPFKVQLNTSLFAQENFVIALDMLVFKHDDAKYVHVNQITNGKQFDKMHLLDVLNSHTDKRIIMPNQSVGRIHVVGEWYVYIPTNGNTLMIESPFRAPSSYKTKYVNILRYIKESSTSVNYENRKLKFRNRYQEVPINKLAAAIGAFGAQFHAQFVEEIIKYVFNVWTNPSVTEKSEYHDFYFKMLYFYDLMRLIIWGSTAKESMRKLYSDYMLPIRAETKDPDVESLSKLSRSPQWSEESMRSSREDFHRSLKLSLQTIESRGKVKYSTGIVKAAPHLLPIGHFMGSAPRFYHPSKDWFENPEYVQKTQEFKENDIIIGYYEKAATALRIRFKIRTPIHKMKRHRDIRMIEKGSICASNSKEYLMEIATKLKIDMDKANVVNLCSAIEAKLINNELEERKKKSNIKWFYSFWETRPDERRQGASSVGST